MTQPENTSKTVASCEKLQDILDSAPGTSIEFDSDSINKLTQLSNRNKLADTDADRIIEVLKEIKHEYTMSARMAKNTLQKLHLTPEQLSVDTRKHLKEAADSDRLRYLGQHPIKEMVNDARTALESAELGMQESAIKRRIRAVTKRDEDIQKQIAVFQRELELAKDEHDTLTSETESRESSVAASNSKVRKQQDTIEQIKENMEKCGMPDERKCKTVLENYEQLKAMKIEIAQLQEEIGKYLGLPPDLAEATRALWQANQEHDQIMQQIANKIQGSKASIH